MTHHVISACFHNPWQIFPNSSKLQDVAKSSKGQNLITNRFVPMSILGCVHKSTSRPHQGKREKTRVAILFVASRVYEENIFAT